MLVRSTGGLNLDVSESALAPAKSLREAGVGRVEVEDPDVVVRPEPVACAGDRGHEGAGVSQTEVVTDGELDLSVQDEEGIDVIDVRMGVDALPAGGEAELDHGQLRQVGLDTVLTELPCGHFALGGKGDDRLGDCAPAACGRIEAVEAFDRSTVAARAQRFGEAPARSMQIEERGRSAALVAERVHHAGRNDDQRSCGRAHELATLRAEPELELAREDIERVHVLPVDVRVRAALARLIPRPGRVEKLMREEDPDRTLGPIGDRLALPGG